MSEVVLMVGDTLSSPDLRHVVPAMVPDPVIYIEQNGDRTVYSTHLDVPLVAAVDGVEALPQDELRLPTDGPATMQWDTYLAELTVRACRARGVQSARTPTRFPFVVAEALAAAGIQVKTDEAFFVERRRVKSAHEIAGIRRATVAVQAGWDAVRRELREREGVTSEELRLAVLREIASHDGIPYDIVILPHGGDAAIGHASGSGVVGAGEPLIADLVVRDRATGGYADATRTFCLGDPPAELQEYYELCREALDAAIAVVAPGTFPEELNAVVSEVFERAGHPTLRETGSGAGMERGFIHELGHGLGLQVHEPPLLGPGATVPLVEGEVLAIEPGLYRTGFGGCRLEDNVLVTGEGCERLTDYGFSLAP